MKKNPIYNFDDSDYEISEEVLDNYDYVYEDEEEVIRNKQIIRKFKLFSLLISIGLIILTIFVTGVVQMEMYKTKEIVTREVIECKEYKNYTKANYDFLNDFFIKIETSTGNIQYSGVFGAFYKELENSGSFGFEELTYYSQYFEEEGLNSEVLRNEVNHIRTLDIKDNPKVTVANSALIASYTNLISVFSEIEENNQTEGSLSFKVVENYMMLYETNLASFVTLYNAL